MISWSNTSRKTPHHTPESSHFAWRINSWSLLYGLTKASTSIEGILEKETICLFSFTFMSTVFNVIIITTVFTIAHAVSIKTIVLLLKCNEMCIHCYSLPKWRRELDPFIHFERALSRLWWQVGSLILLKQASAIGCICIFVSRFCMSDMTIPPFSFKLNQGYWLRPVV